MSPTSPNLIDFSCPDGSLCQGHFTHAGADRPGVVVLQEWWGLNAQICSVVDRFAAAGFNALAPDLFRGRVTQDPDEAGHMMNGLDFAGATFQDIRGAVAHLQKVGSGPVAVMGFCMGGALTVASAVHLPEVAAAVCFYGIPPRDFADPAQIRIPFQGHFATRDTWCTPAAAGALEQAMLGAGACPEIHHYEAAHGFFNATRPQVYDPAQAELAWTRTLAFLERHL